MIYLSYFICRCVCLSMWTCECKYLWGPEEFIRTPVAVVTNSCEWLDIGAGYEPESSTKAANTTNQRAIYPATSPTSYSNF